MDSSSLKKAMFFVGNRPHAVWDPDIREKNLQILRRFDTHQFEYLADVHSAQIDTEHAQQAATALRISYGLALETFISLLGAALQAPDCVFGWLYRYKQEDLSLAVQGIKGSKRLRTRFPGQLTWESLSNVVHRNLVLHDKTREAEIKARFALFWEYVTTDYLDLGQRAEFNSTKHGLRLQPGGFRAAIGLQKHPDVPAPPERMQGIGGSEFGSTILILEQIKKNTFDYRVRENSRNWDLASLAGRIRIISMSVNNVVSFLLIFNGQDPAQVQFFWPDDLTDFDTVWESDCGLLACSMGVNINENDICPTKAEEVEKSYVGVNKESAGD
jgi:hypothetical protein